MQLLLDILFRWMHVLAAMAAVGGTFFMRLALLPAMSELPEESRKALQQALRSRWSKVVMASIGLLLLSGLYNISLTLMRYEVPSFYVALFCVKFILALAIFYIASALMGRSPAFERIRLNARFWLTINMILAIALVCISGVLRMTEKRVKPTTPLACRSTTHPSDRAAPDAWS